MFANYDSHVWDLSSHGDEPFAGAWEILRSETAFCGTVAPVPGSLVEANEVLEMLRTGQILGAAVLEP